MIKIAKTLSALSTRTAALSMGAVLLTASPVAAQMAGHSDMKQDKTIVGVAIEAGSFTTLVAALQAADLTTALQGPGPFTVFAPSDAAFAKLPAGTVEALLKDKTALAGILTYHVIPGKVMAADVIKAGVVKPTTLNGATLDIRVKDGKVYVNGAMVTSADIGASNGVIHVIDAVVLPPTTK
ncbi:MAG TPA: fasciclin domain-containing protein [Gemmatimonadales bacterium]|nr:fasciclin domain-containing protein [Gemmatimonadales bacterium]